MAGFDVGSLTPGLLREYLEDKKVEMAQLNVWQRFCDVRNVVDREGKILLFNTALRMPNNGHRTSKVSPLDNTPLSSASAGSREYLCDDFRNGLPITRAEEKQISTAGGMEDLILQPVEIVLGDYNKEVAATLRAEGTAGTFDDVTEKAVSNVWSDTTNGTPLDDIDSVIDILGSGVDAILGAKVARTLGRHPDVTGSAAGSGREYVNFDMVRNFLRDRGCSRVFIIDAQMQDGEPDATRSYADLYENVFALSIPGNLVAPVFIPLEQSIEDDRLNKRKSYVAHFSGDIITGRAEHTYGFTGILS